MKIALMGGRTQNKSRLFSAPLLPLVCYAQMAENFAPIGSYSEPDENISALLKIESAPLRKYFCPP